MSRRAATGGETARAAAPAGAAPLPELSRASQAPKPRRAARGRRGASAVATGAPRAAEEHLTAEEIAQLLSRWQDPAEVEHRAIRQLLACCKTCREIAERVRRVTAEAAHWDDVLALAESAQAPELWRRLEDLSFGDQIDAVLDEEGAYRTWGLCRLLQRLSGEATAQHPPQAAKAAELARLAVAVSEDLEPTYDEDWIQDLQARSYALLGDARRELGELHGAADAFELARLCRQAGTEYPSVEAEVAALEALLRRDERRLVTAAALFERVHQLHTDPESTTVDPDAADAHLAGRALLHRAWCLFHLGQAEAAEAALDQAAQLIDEQREPPLGLALRHGRVWTAIVQGRFEAAETLLAPAAVVASQLGDDGVRLRLRRAAARVAAAAGEEGAAKQTLRETAAGFAEIDLGVDSALALLELAGLCLRSGDREGLRPLAAELLPAFSSADVQRDEMHVLLLVQHAIEENRLTLALAEQLAALLERGRRPSLAWWSGWGTALSREKIDDAKRTA